MSGVPSVESQELPRSIECFSLAKHEGDYENWPLETELYHNGQATCASVAGSVLEAQYAMAAGYLLVSTWDCPFEEMATFLLLDTELNLLSRTDLGGWYATGEFKNPRWTDPKTLEFCFFGDERWQLAIVTRWRRPFLSLSKLEDDYE